MRCRTVANLYFSLLALRGSAHAMMPTVGCVRSFPPLYCILTALSVQCSVLMIPPVLARPFLPFFLYEHDGNPAGLRCFCRVLVFVEDEGIEGGERELLLLDEFSLLPPYKQYISCWESTNYTPTGVRIQRANRHWPNRASYKPF